MVLAASAPAAGAEAWRSGNEAERVENSPKIGEQPLVASTLAGILVLEMNYSRRESLHGTS
jgi:hypothetical protein